MNLSESDLVRSLTAARPTDDDLAAVWPADERAALWAQISNEEPAEVTDRRRPYRTAWLVAAAAMIAAVAVPTVMSSGEASAHEQLLQLALVAAKSDTPVIAPGTYLHVKTESLQQNSSLLSDGERRDTNREEWIRWDGRSWAIDTRPSAGWTEYHQFAPPREASFGTPSPQFVASLPDDPGALRAYLDKTVSGSNSHNEALFVAISDLASSRMLDPATFGTALKMLANVDGVKTNDLRLDGRDAVEVSFEPHFGIGFLGRESFTVDRDTAQILRVSDSGPGGTYESRTTLIEVVDTIPDSITKKYKDYKNGARICADGQEANGDGACPTP